MSIRATAALLAGLAVVIACYLVTLQRCIPQPIVEVIEPEHGAYLIKVHAYHHRSGKKLQQTLDGRALELAEEAAAKLETKWGRRPISTLIVLCRVQYPDGTVRLVPLEMMVVFIPPGQFPPPDDPVH